MGSLVLVVDDSQAFRDLAGRILRGWGHEVIEADSVATAVARATELRPQAALVDIGLPDGYGFHLAETLVALPGTIKVLLVSTDSDIGNDFAARRVGARGFFPKDQILSAEFRLILDEG